MSENSHGRDPSGPGCRPSDDAASRHPGKAASIPRAGSPDERVLIYNVDEEKYWLSHGRGMTPDVDEAHVYTRARAEKHLDGYMSGMEIIPLVERNGRRRITEGPVRPEPNEEWLPIKSAPKDGTLFLAYAAPGQHDLPELYSLCAWHEDAGFCICELREPTHWMPLPRRPQGIEARSAETRSGSAEGESPVAEGHAPDLKAKSQESEESAA